MSSNRPSSELESCELTSSLTSLPSANLLVYLLLGQTVWCMLRSTGYDPVSSTSPRMLLLGLDPPLTRFPPSLPPSLSLRDCDVSEPMILDDQYITAEGLGEQPEGSKSRICAFVAAIRLHVVLEGVVSSLSSATLARFLSHPLTLLYLFLLSARWIHTSFRLRQLSLPLSSSSGHRQTTPSERGSSRGRGTPRGMGSTPGTSLELLGRDDLE